MSLDPQPGANQTKRNDTDEERCAKLMRTIAWLDALTDTAMPDVVAAQRSRLAEELRQIALRRQRMFDIHVDVTKRRRLEQHKDLLIRELDHRFKNMLSVISVIASRTQETTSSTVAFETALDGRINALMMTHELLSRHRRHGISLFDLVHQELAPYAIADNTEIKGSDHILRADAGLVIGMVLHELATNAAKYGALSNKDGRVSVCWRKQQNGHGENQLRIDWQERGGPLVVPQSRCGYGTSVIRELIPYELGGAVDLAHSRGGVRCNLDIPTHWLADSTPPPALGRRRCRFEAAGPLHGPTTEAATLKLVEARNGKCPEDGIQSTDSRWAAAATLHRIDWFAPRNLPSDMGRAHIGSTARE